MAAPGLVLCTPVRGLSPELSQYSTTCLPFPSLSPPSSALASVRGPHAFGGAQALTREHQQCLAR